MLFKNKAVCTKTMDELSRRRLGASGMYRRSLPDIDGVPPIVAKQGPFPRASSFAERLLTLPVHDRVSLQDTYNALRVIADNLRISPGFYNSIEIILSKRFPAAN